MTEFLIMIFPAIVLTIGFAYIVVKDNKKIKLKVKRGITDLKFEFNLEKRI